jgi:hypothetical protein
MGCSDASGTITGDVLVFDASPVSPVPTPPVDAGPPSIDAAGATFTAVYSQIINGPPGCNGCHANPGAAAGLDMGTQASAYASLVGQHVTAAAPCVSQSVLLVDPGNANESLMYLKVTSPPCGGRMPLGGSMLSSDLIQLIEAWIDAGAKND